MPDEERIAELRDRMDRSPFHTWAGMRLVRGERGSVEVALDPQPHHRNLMGTLHGGMIAVLADTATGLAMLSALEPGTTHLTSSLSLTYLAVAAPGRVTAAATVLKAGRRFGYAEADVRDAAGALLARAAATFTVLPERPPQ